VNQERQQRCFRVRISDQRGKLQILVRESHYIFEGICLEDISSSIYYNWLMDLIHRMGRAYHGVVKS
jgi:hypothetical protein